VVDLSQAYFLFITIVVSWIRISVILSGMAEAVKNGSVPLIGTHSGSFHCDEALACALLTLLPRYASARILRSRDLQELAKCDVVVDVGAVYEPATHRYDHHQRTFSETMNSLDSSKPWKIKLSSAGLVYNHFGREVLAHTLGVPLKDPLVEKIFDKVYENFIIEIDAIDNGVSTHEDEGKYRISTNLSARVSHLGPVWNSSDQDFTAGFHKAVALTQTEFLDRVNYYGKVWWAARDLVSTCLQSRFKVHESGKILEFGEGGLPWKEHLFELEAENGISGDSSLLYALFSDQSGMWRIQCVPKQAKSFENRKSLPAAWRGLRDEELVKVSGVDGATFIHASGFIGGCKTKEGIRKMAEIALASDS